MKSSPFLRGHIPNFPEEAEGETRRARAPNKEADFRQFLDGTRLYGDDFTFQEIERWYSDEKEAYFQLLSKSEPKGRDSYGYHTLNWRYGFRLIAASRFARALGVGSAWGAEFEPILDRIGHLTILEPSAGFITTQIRGVPVEYIPPGVSGDFPFADKSFDLITCLGVLHHIPNVSKVIGEIFRCLAAGGYALIREPTISMGDWRVPRPGLTPRERGIPLHLLREIIANAGFEVVSERRCMFQLTYNLEPLLGGSVWNSRPVLILDKVLCVLFAGNTSYHPSSRLQKLRPIAVYYVLRRPV